VTDTISATCPGCGGRAAIPSRLLGRFVRCSRCQTRFQVAEADAYGTRVRAYTLPDNVQAGRMALHYAVVALQVCDPLAHGTPAAALAIVQRTAAEGGEAGAENDPRVEQVCVVNQALAQQ